MGALFLGGIMLDKVLNLLYPPVCGICGKIDYNYICPKCKVILKKIEKGQIISYKAHHFEKHFYLFIYEGIIREKLIQYKFQNQNYLCDFFSKILLNNEKLSRILKNYDIIIPVPMYPQKEKIRGYNQTSIIAKKIAEKSKCLDFDDTVLKKIKNTKTQSSLNKSDRMNNIKNAYKVFNIQKIKNKKVILLDDIYTTGATVNECSKMLKKSGTKEVLVITIAKD